MAFSSKSELQSLAPATPPPSPLSISAGNTPEIREVAAMSDIKIYQRRQKEMNKEKQQLGDQNNWVPETPVKPVPVRRQNVYVKRRLKADSGPSFLSRISKAEAEADHDTTVMTLATEKEETEEKSESSKLSCLTSTSEVSIDLNKTVCDTEGVDIALCGFEVDGVSRNGVGDICTFIEESNVGLADRDVPMDNLYRSSELSTYLSLAPPSRCGIDRSPDASFRGLDITSEHFTNNFLPEIRNLSESLGLKNESNNSESHVIECNRENNVQLLEPATPLIKHNKRPSSVKDANPRPAKKLKFKKKRHRPKVVVDCVPRRPVKNSPVKKEKTVRVKKTQPMGKEKKSARKRLKTSNNETSTIENHAEIVAADSSVGVLQFHVEGGPGTSNRGNEGSDEKMLLAIPELPSIHSTHDNVTTISELHLETKSTPQSDVGENIPSETNVVCQYALRIRHPKKVLDCQCTDSCGHKEASKVYLCVRKSTSEQLSFPTSHKKTRMKRKRRSRLYIVLMFFQLKGRHPKKKRSKRSVRSGKMVGLLTREQFEVQILNPFAALQLTDKSTDAQKAFNHEDIIFHKEEPCIKRPNSAGEFMLPSIGETGEVAPYQGSFPMKVGAIVPHKGSASPEKSALVPHQGFLSPKKSAIVLHRTPVHAKKYKPVIDIDPETMRRWIQIKRIEDGLGKEEEEVDEETKRRWEDARKLFRGRVDVFTNRLHLVLGDRRFKEWKGSVVDSVVGVFLTQNVSDFLSSSAYMALTAKFPNEESNQEEFNSSQESTGSTDGTTKDLPGSQYFVTTYDEEGLVDIEDIGKPISPRMSYGNRNIPLSSETMNDIKNSSRMHPPNFNEFYQTFCSSSVLPQDCYSKAEVGIGSNLNSEFCSQAEVGTENNLNFIDMQHDKNLKVDEVIPDGSSNPVDNSNNMDTASKKARQETAAKKVEKKDWDRLRKKYSRPRTSDHRDTIDWEAVRQADVSIIAEIIKARGQHTIIAGRIKDFLNRVVELHGSIDLEWLRYAPDMDVQNYLLDIPGLGLKSVECIRLLALNHIAFPVDVNVARVSVRIGWVPLKPLPGDLQFHLLEEYPIMDSVQKYLKPRLSEFDSQTLYELHYHLITFGKIFCKKRSPNCGACPMRPECRHYASAVAASTNLNLPGPTNADSERSTVLSTPLIDSHSLTDDIKVANPKISVTLLEYGVTSERGLETYGLGPLVEEPKSPELVQNTQDSRESEDNRNCHVDCGLEYSGCVPSIEEPKSPELVQESENDCDRNDCDCVHNQLIDNEEEEEIPTIILSNEEFRKNVQYFMDKNRNNLADGNSSRALVPLSVDVNSSSVHKLKRTKHLRTEHEVYEIPDGHEILTGLERRDPDDSVPYLLAIWTAGETPNSVRQPEKKCNSEGGSELCNDPTCFACQSIREGQADIVRGTILIPCRTAMRARFPLNGTYFQVNEVFADHETSCDPLIISRSSIWNLRRRIVFFGTSPSSIFTKECSLQEIQLNFWKGFICLRGFDRKTRGPKPLAPRFHCSPSKMEKTPRKVNPDKVKKNQPKPKPKPKPNPKPKRSNQEKTNDDPNKPQGSSFLQEFERWLTRA